MFIHQTLSHTHTNTERNSFVQVCQCRSRGGRELYSRITIDTKEVQQAGRMYYILCSLKSFVRNLELNTHGLSMSQREFTK